MSEKNDKTISIVGCGWLGFPLAVRLLEQGYATVRGSTTSYGKLPMLREAGIEACEAILDPEPKGGNWSELLQADTLIVDIPPRLSKQGGDFHPRQMRNLTALIEKSPVSEIIYVSSTSVYPELSRVMVEEDVTKPEESASPCLIEAEQIMVSLRDKGRNVTILRCGGLMGYDRIPGKYVRGRQGITTGNVPVNYIHRDDVAAIISELLTRGISDETYNAVAPEHPTRRAIYEKSCLDHGWELPTFTEPEVPEPFKRVSSDNIIHQLHYIFLYPDPLEFQYDKIEA
ncbi:NAD(P)H-binding protein [Persicitalea sp.]|uniref:NAD(P)H-binding protein n=1 Tax=Persicitalea sp. TaxID=3100273 RepID=UPI00359474D3